MFFPKIKTRNAFKSLLLFAGKTDADLGMLVQTVTEPPVLTADLQYQAPPESEDKKQVVLRLLTMAGQSVVDNIIFKPTDKVSRTFLPKIEKQLAKCRRWTEALWAYLIPLEFVVTT